MTFTLPKPTAALLGHWYRFLGVANQNLIVAAPVAETLISRNGTAFSSLHISTDNEKIGAEIEAECIEFSAGVYRWVAVGIAVSHTYTRSA